MLLSQLALLLGFTLTYAQSKYANMQNVLQDINRRFVSLPDEDVRRNNRILESVLTLFINKMKTKDPLFAAMYRRVFYGGSYYDGLRVGRPEEFDLDLLLHIPTYSEPVLSQSNIPGFVRLQLKNWDRWMKQPEAKVAYSKFEKLLLDKDRYLSTDKALAWMEGIVQKSLNDFPYRNGSYILENLEVKFTKGGPALTLHISGSGVKMDVDLVTCFVFSGDKWPIGFRSNPFPSTKSEFFIVPKKPKTNPDKQPLERCWRLSFQEQERELLDNKRALKPTIKLLKKLRDTEKQFTIASYYIKTVLLQIIAQKEETFWQKPLSHVFMTVLKEYKEFIHEGKIPYYWNKNNNLIGGVNGGTLQNINNRLGIIIKNIENNPDKPEIVAKYLLTSDEYQAFIRGDNVIAEAGAAQGSNEQSSCSIV